MAISGITLKLANHPPVMYGSDELARSTVYTIGLRIPYFTVVVSSTAPNSLKELGGPHKSVSRVHAALRVDQEIVTVADLGGLKGVRYVHRDGRVSTVEEEGMALRPGKHDLILGQHLPLELIITGNYTL